MGVERDGGGEGGLTSLTIDVVVSEAFSISTGFTEALTAIILLYNRYYKPESI